MMLLLESSSAYISIIGASLTCFLLLILYLLIGRSSKSCKIFQSADSVNCCWCCRKPSATDTCRKNSKRISRELAKSFSFENDKFESNLDYEDLLQQLQRPSVASNKLTNNSYMTKLNECLSETNRWYQLRKPKNNYRQQYDNHVIIDDNDLDDALKNSALQECESLIRNKVDLIVQPIENHFNPISINEESINFNLENSLKSNRSRNLLKQQAIYTSFALKNNSKAFENMFSDHHNYHLKKSGTNNHNSNDLISLAEKGRIGKQASTDGSISSETGSAEETVLQRRNILKRLKTESSAETTESKDDHHKYQTLSNHYHCDNNYESDTQSSNLPDFSPNATLSSEPNPMSSLVIKGGRLEVAFAYDAPTKRLSVTVIQGVEIPHKKQHTSVCQIYVKVILMPHKKQKFRTKSKPIFCPVFDETFIFNKIDPQEIMDLGLRFRVFSQGFTRKTHLIGECRLPFACMKPQQQETKLWFTLEIPNKRNLLSDLESSSLARTDSTSTQSGPTSSPELLLGLSYNGTTGRLSVTIIKGSQFGNLSTRTPDTYLKVLLISQSGNEIARGKTQVCRGQPNPMFRETFVFQVALFQLPDVTLMILVYNKRSIKRKELIGWISLGYNSSGDEELSHWNDMRDNKGEQVSRWHVLNESS